LHLDWLLKFFNKAQYKKANATNIVNQLPIFGDEQSLIDGKTFIWIYSVRRKISPVAKFYLY